jgi:hypothetical protein
MEYQDDDREYIRVRPKKTDLAVTTPLTSVSNMASLIQDYLSKPEHASSDVQGKHTVYWMPCATFAKLKIKKWKYNRPCDETRIAEIREWMDRSKRVDGVIYLACVDDELVCYESNHRRLALQGLEGLHNILVDILWNATDEDVKQEFQRLNKAVSVPEIYVVDAPVVSEAELRPIVEEFCERFKSHRVNTKHPQKPNFNRDMIFDQFYRLCGELQIGPKELLEKIKVYNDTLIARDKTGLSEKVKTKCEASGLWLFAWSSQIHLV